MSLLQFFLLKWFINNSSELVMTSKVKKDEQNTKQRLTVEKAVRQNDESNSRLHATQEKPKEAAAVVSAGIRSRSDADCFYLSLSLLVNRRVNHSNFVIIYLRVIFYFQLNFSVFPSKDTHLNVLYDEGLETVGLKCFLLLSLPLPPSFVFLLLYAQSCDEIVRLSLHHRNHFHCFLQRLFHYNDRRHLKYMGVKQRDHWLISIQVDL